MPLYSFAEVDEVVEATDAVCCRRRDSSRVRRLTCQENGRVRVRIFVHRTSNILQLLAPSQAPSVALPQSGGVDGVLVLCPVNVDKRSAVKYILTWSKPHAGVISG